MHLQLKDKVVLVSSGAHGIGAAMVRACGEEGAIPVIVDRNAEAGKQLQSELRDKRVCSEFIVVDLLTSEGCSRAVKRTVETLGQLDALIINAGVPDSIDLEHGSPAQLVTSLECSLLHYYNLAHYALPHLKASHGAIVNIIPEIGPASWNGASGYASTKGAILALTREWAAELLRYGIRVNAIVPAETTPHDHHINARDEIASMALFLISANARHVTGQYLFAGVEGARKNCEEVE